MTGDAVVLDLRPARLPTRLLADLIDIVAMAALAWGWDWLTRQFDGSTAAVRAVSILGFIVISLGYPITFETLTRGRTPGAYALGLRVVRDDGGSIRFRHALMRGLAFWLVDYSVWTGFTLGAIVCAVHPQGKRVGDILAGTIEIRTRSPKASEPIPDPDPRWASWAQQLEMSRVTEEQFAAARYALARRAQMRPDYRALLIGELAAQITRRTAPAPPAALSAEDFLITLLGENRRRATGKVLASFGVPSSQDLPAGWR